MKAYEKKNYITWEQTDVAPVLRSSGGDIGGVRDFNHILYSPTVGALQARDYKGVGSQYVEEDKLIIEVVQ